MKIAVISDLHLGSGDQADRSRSRDERLLRHLDFLEAHFEVIVLLGDIWETLASPLPMDRPRELARARAAHPAIAQRFRARPYLYIAGNHDLCATSEGVQDQAVLESHGVRILLAHGHQFDPLVQRARWFTELVVWLVAWLTRVDGGLVFRLYELLETWMRAWNHRPDRCRFQLAAIEAARQTAADVVVTGHTHFPTLAWHGDRLFLNAGHCTRGEIHFVSIDTEERVYAVQRATLPEPSMRDQSVRVWPLVYDRGPRHVSSGPRGSRRREQRHQLAARAPRDFQST